MEYMRIEHKHLPTRSSTELMSPVPCLLHFACCAACPLHQEAPQRVFVLNALLEHTTAHQALEHASAGACICVLKWRYGTVARNMHSEEERDGEGVRRMGYCLRISLGLFNAIWLLQGGSSAMRSIAVLTPRISFCGLCYLA